jgi:cathepsin A (carboxypeptidase C)
MFYWFFRNTVASDPPRPVIIWLSGGPGTSSVGALFEDIGPLRVNKTGETDDDWNVYAAQYSWADTYHLLFIDQPVDTGFSWGDSISENI